MSLTHNLIGCERSGKPGEQQGRFERVKRFVPISMVGLVESDASVRCDDY